MSGVTKAALESDQQAIKILANATSYGIFVELNVEDYKTAKTMIANGSEGQSQRGAPGQRDTELCLRGA